MREFRKKDETKPWWEVLLNILLWPFGISFRPKAHDDLNRKGRSKTKFDR